MKVVFYVLLVAVFGSIYCSEGEKVMSEVVCNQKKVDTSFGKVSYLDTLEDKPAVVCIHGNSCSSKVFRKQVDSLKDDFRMICIDLPGHGGSDNLSKSNLYSIPNYARVVDEVVSKLNIGKFHLVGFSLGGNIALQLSQINQDILSITMISSAPIHYSNEALYGYPPHEENFSAKAEQLSYEQAKRFMGGCGFKVEEDECFFMVEDAVRAEGRSRVEMVDSVLGGDGVDEVDIVSHLSIPLAIIAGESDTVLGVEYLQNLDYKNLWKNQIQLLPGGTHAILFHQEKEVNNLILSFLKNFV